MLANGGWDLIQRLNGYGSALVECESGWTAREYVQFRAFLIPGKNLINKSFRGR